MHRDRLGRRCQSLGRHCRLPPLLRIITSSHPPVGGEREEREGRREEELQPWGGATVGGGDGGGLRRCGRWFFFSCLVMLSSLDDATTDIHRGSRSCHCYCSSPIVIALHAVSPKYIPSFRPTFGWLLRPPIQQKPSKSKAPSFSLFSFFSSLNLPPKTKSKHHTTRVETGCVSSPTTPPPPPTPSFG
jgi:hypothetical protein